MNPAFSVIFLTTLIGAAQGLFMALFGAELAGFGQGAGQGFLALAGGVALLLACLGLLASFFHLGHPERAWRAAAMWRTSWLSREVIALPLFMAMLACWAAAHALGLEGTFWLGLLALLACAALFVCTAMVYASLRFLQEWASPLTLINYALLGLASGCTLALALAGFGAPELVPAFGTWALLFTMAGGASRGLSLRRNARLKPRSTLQSAIGMRHPQIRQRSQGFMGSAYNLREFFHGQAPRTLRHVKAGFVVGAFVLPAVLIVAGLSVRAPLVLLMAFAVQYVGLLAERWFFLAQANHPQNLYYQAVS